MDGLPIDCWDFPDERAPCLHFLVQFDIGVDAASFLEGRDPSSHPGCTTCKLIVRCHDRPVESPLERDEPVHGADKLALQKRIGQISMYMAICAVDAVRMVAFFCCRRGPGRWDLRRMS